VANELPTDRDADGRAIKADLSLLFRFRDVDRTFSRRLARALPLLDPTDPVGIDFTRAPEMLGGETSSQETFGAYAHDYTASTPRPDLSST